MRNGGGTLHAFFRSHFQFSSDVGFWPIQPKFYQNQKVQEDWICSEQGTAKQVALFHGLHFCQPSKLHYFTGVTFSVTLCGLHWFAVDIAFSFPNWGGKISHDSLVASVEGLKGISWHTHVLYRFFIRVYT